jgi:hypothetical protein
VYWDDFMKLIAIVMCLLVLYWQRRPIRPVAFRVTNLYLAQVFKYFNEGEQLKAIEVFLLLLLPTAVIFLLGIMIAGIGNDDSASGTCHFLYFPLFYFFFLVVRVIFI